MKKLDVLSMILIIFPAMKAMEKAFDVKVVKVVKVFDRMPKKCGAPFSDDLLTLVSLVYTDEVREKIEAGADVNIKDNSGKTPLHCAAMGPSTEIAEMLIDAGADLRARNSDGETPLDVATPTMRKLLEEKAKARE